jgi:hypothetical protein
MLLDFQDFLVLVPEAVSAGDARAAEEPHDQDHNDDYSNDAYSAIVHDVVPLIDYVAEG